MEQRLNQPLKKKFGAKSLNATAATAYANLVLGPISNFSATNSTWTIDFFFFLSATNANLAVLTSTTTFSFTITYVTASTRLALSLGQGTTFNIANASLITGTPTVSTWHHIAIVFTGTSYLAYFNGTLGLTINNTAKITSTAFNTLRLGGNGTTKFNGFIDEFRISDNVRFSSNFTVPASQATVDANTISLNHFEQTLITDSDDNSNNIQLNFFRNGEYYTNSLLYMYGLQHNTSPGYILSNRSNISNLVDLPSGYSTINAIKLPFCIPIVSGTPLSVSKIGNYIAYNPQYTIVTGATNITTISYVLSNVIPNHCKMVSIMIIHTHVGNISCSVLLGSSNNTMSYLTIASAGIQTLVIQVPIYNYDQSIQAYLSATASTTSYALYLIGIYF